MFNFLIWEILLPMVFILAPLGVATVIEYYKEVGRW